MNRKILCILLATLFLAGCSGNKDENKDKESGTGTTEITTENATDTVTGNTTETEEAVTIGVTIPPIPEEGVPEIPDAEVLYSDTEVVIVVDPEGTSYANGKPVTPDEAGNIIVQQISPSKPETTTTSTAPSPVVSGTTTKPYDDIMTALPGFVPETEETLPEGTYYIDDTVDKEEGTDNNRNPDNVLEIVDLAKYVSTGKNDLGITDIKVFTNSKPGVEGVDAFKPGDTIIVNLWCDPLACLDSTLYIVPMEAEHKDSYETIEYLLKYDMYTAFEAGENQMVFEITLPEHIPANIYEFRFVCGSEEGYIPFHIG